MARGGDGRWVESDLDEVIAAYRDWRETCDGCGTRKSEWGEYRDGVFVEFDPPPYVAKSTTDPGCAAIDRKREMDSQGFKGKFPPGYRVWLAPND